MTAINIIAYVLIELNYFLERSNDKKEFVFQISIE